MSVLLSDVQISQVTQQSTTKWQVVNPQFIEDLSHVVCKAQLKAVIEWLDRPCVDHHVQRNDIPLYAHRRDCPECRENLKGEAGL